MESIIHASRNNREIVESLLKKSKAGLSVTEVSFKTKLGKRQIQNILKQLILEGKVNTEPNSYPPKYFFIKEANNLKLNEKDVSFYQEKIEEYLKSKNVREGRPVIWKHFLHIAFHYGIDHRKPELKIAAENVVKKYKLRWVPGKEPPKN